MGLREAIITTISILGFTAAASADTKKPAKAEPAKTAKKPAADSKAADAKAADAKAADAKAEADPAAGSDADAGEAELPPHLVGPKHVDLGNNTSLDLPEGVIMFERAVAQELLRKADEPSERVVAILLKPESTWHISIEYADSGYIEDSDADELDPDDLLDSYRKGTEEQNKIRKSHGNPELIIDGWAEKPKYERPVHHLVWGLSAHSTEGKVVNFFTRVLGRNGFLSLNLIDSPERLEASKKEAAAVLQAVRFNTGATYADHVSSDRSSGIGLRGLVLGGAGVAVASKLGFLAKILLVFKKGIILLVAGIGALFAKIFRRKSEPTTSDSPPPMGGPGDGSSG